MNLAKSSAGTDRRAKRAQVDGEATIIIGLELSHTVIDLTNVDSGTPVDAVSDPLTRPEPESAAGLEIVPPVSSADFDAPANDPPASIAQMIEADVPITV